ncbi:MAG: hypothetical protein VX777_07460 [Chlamydiota bacterium]|nr:hypothetical protein [Chlamydiota bacterium]
MNNTSSLTSNYRNLVHQVNLDLYIKSNIDTVDTTKTLFQLLFQQDNRPLPTINSGNHLENILSNHSFAVVERIEYEFKNSLNNAECTSNYFPKTPPEEKLKVFSQNLLNPMSQMDWKTIGNVQKIFNSIINKFPWSEYSPITVILNSILNEDEETVYEIITNFLQNGISAKYKWKVICLLLKKNYIETANKLVLSDLINLEELLPIFHFLDNTTNIYNHPVFIETLLAKFPTSHSLIISIIYAYINTNDDLKAEKFFSEKTSVLLNNPTDVGDLYHFESSSPKLIDTIMFIFKNIEDSRAISILENFLDTNRLNFIKRILAAVQADPAIKNLFNKPSEKFETFILNLLGDNEFLEIIGNFNAIQYSTMTAGKIKNKLNRLLKAFESKVHQNIETRLKNFIYISNLVINNKNFTTKRYNPNKLLENVQINGTPILLKAIELDFFKEALILFKNGTVSEKTKCNYSTALYKLAERTGYFSYGSSDLTIVDFDNGRNRFKTWREEEKIHFLKLFDLLVDMNNKVNPNNKDQLNAIALIKDLDCAKTLIKKYQHEIDTQDLINQCLITANIELALDLYDGDQINISKDERILQHACIALNRRVLYDNQKKLLVLIQNVFDQIQSIEISTETSDIIHNEIIFHYSETYSSTELPHKLFEQYAPLFKLKISKKINNYWMRKVPFHQINDYINLIGKIESIGKVHNDILEGALRNAVFFEDVNQIKNIISITQSHKYFNPRYFAKVVLKQFSIHQYSNLLFDCLKQLNPNFLDAYFKDKHIIHFLFASTWDNPLSLKTLFNFISYLIQNHDLNINSVYDRVTGETIFSAFVTSFEWDPYFIKNLFEISNPQLDIRFKDDATIFHVLVEKYHEELYETFNFLAEKYPDWINLIGKIKNPFTSSVLKTSPAVPLFIHSDKFDLEKLFFARGATDFDKQLAIDFIKEINMAFPGRKKTHLLPKIVSILKNANREELFKPNSSNELIFHHLCKYTPLEECAKLIPLICLDQINVQDSSGMTAFQYALKYNSYQTVLYLLKLGGDYNVTLEGNKNILHYQWQNILDSKNQALYDFLPKSFQNDNLKNSLYSVTRFLSLQNDDELELPKQKIYNLNIYNNLIHVSLNNYFKQNINSGQYSHQDIEKSQIHQFLTQLLPTLELGQYAYDFNSFLIELGLFNYAAPLIKDYKELDWIPMSDDLKLMLCYEPATFEFKGLKELETFQLKDPAEIFEEKFDSIKNAKRKISDAKKIILEKLNEIDRILEEDELKADSDPSKYSDVVRLQNMTLKFCINNLLLIINKQKPRKINEILTEIKNACSLPLGESLTKCSDLIEKVVGIIKNSKDFQGDFIIDRLEKFSKNEHITAAPNEETQRMYEYQKIMLVILSIQYLIEGKNDCEKKEQMETLNKQCGLCLTGMLSNLFQIYEKLTGKKMTLSTREGFIRTLETFRSGIFDQFASQCGLNDQSTHTVNHLLQKFGDTLGVSKSRSNKGDIYNEPSEEFYKLFINTFYLKHQTNLLVYIIQQQFLEAYADNQDATTDYIKSLTPKGSDEYDFLTQAMLIEGDKIQLSVYGALTILVDLEIYKVSDHALPYIEKITSFSDSEDESIDDDVLDQLGKRLSTETQENQQPARKKQKL